MYSINSAKTSQKYHDVSSIDILEALLLKAMKVDFHAWFETHYNGNVGSAVGSSESLFSDICETGGPVKKRRRTAYAPPPSEYIPALMTAVHSTRVIFKSGDPLYEKNASTIQRWWISGIKQWTAKNSSEDDDGSYPGNVLRWNQRIILCPITLEAIPRDDSATIVTPEGYVWIYTLTSLLDYFRETADFRCPLTRFEFDLPRIKQLKRRAIKLGIPAFTLVQDYHRRDLAKQQKQEHENALTGLESICGELFAEAINQLSKGEDTDKMLINIETMILPEWKSHLRILAGMEKERCINMLTVEKTRLTELLSRRHTENVLDVNSPWLRYLKTQVDDEIRYINSAFVDVRPAPHGNGMVFIRPNPSPNHGVNGNRDTQQNRGGTILSNHSETGDNNIRETEMSFTDLMHRYMNSEHMPIGSVSGQFQLGPDTVFPRFFRGHVLPPPPPLSHSHSHSHSPLSPFRRPLMSAHEHPSQHSVGVDLYSLSQLRR